MKIEIKENTIELSFNYDPKIIKWVKEIYGRKWDPEKKKWSIPLTEENKKRIKDKFPENFPNFEEEKKELPITEPKNIKTNLFSFQKQGLSFLLQKNGKAIIGDEMGLGKTIQAISYLSYDNSTLPALIVCPASLKYNWKNEIEKHSFLTCEIINGKTDIETNKNIYIINYDILEKKKEKIKTLNARTIILDECHYIKNKKAQRTKTAIELFRNAEKIIGLSGTPIINRPSEYFTILNLIAPQIFPSFWKFAERYCGLNKTRFGWKYDGATHTKELYEILNNNIMIRRKKEDVLKDLPDKIRTVIPVEIDNRQEYEKEENETILNETLTRAEALVKIEKLKQTAVKGKLNQIIEWVENFLESDNKLVLFATHKKTLDTIQEKFPEISVRIDGSTPQEKRQEIVDEFNTSETKKIFLGNIKAAGVGLTLTAASTVLFTELAWTPGEHKQAEDRIHRIGQKECCNIYYVIAQNTIEEKISKILQKKLSILTEILDGENVKENEEIYTLLVEELKKK